MLFEKEGEHMAKDFGDVLKEIRSLIAISNA